MKFNSFKYMADQTMWYKYVVKNVVRKYGKIATFMLKSIFPSHDQRAKNRTSRSAPSAVRAITWLTVVSAGANIRIRFIG